MYSSTLLSHRGKSAPGWYGPTAGKLRSGAAIPCQTFGRTASSAHSALRGRRLLVALELLGHQLPDLGLQLGHLCAQLGQLTVPLGQLTGDLAGVAVRGGVSSTVRGGAGRRNDRSLPAR